MTAEELEIPNSAELLRRQTIVDTEGIRQVSFTRLITIHNLIQAEYEEKGPVYTDWLNQREKNVDITFTNFLHGITVQDYQALVDLGDEYFDIQSDFLAMSNRTVEDYLKTLRALVTY
jgi:hypothetical protein